MVGGLVIHKCYFIIIMHTFKNLGSLQDSEHHKVDLRSCMKSLKSSMIMENNMIVEISMLKYDKQRAAKCKDTCIKTSTCSMKISLNSIV
jgi:hypothetical protein